jgi:DNA-binding response OmpR family regulator
MSAAPKPRTDTQASTPAAPPESAIGRVLVVEPDQLTRWSLHTYLSRWFEVVAVAGTEGPPRADERPFDALVLSDRVARDLARALLRQSRLENPDLLAVLLVTGDREPAADLVADARIEKPFALTELAHLLGVAREAL